MSSCELCDAKTTRSDFFVKDQQGALLSFYKCEACKTRFLNPQPSAEELEKAYDALYYGSGSMKFHPLIESLIGYFRNREAKKMAKKLKGAGQVLDVGCGNGDFLHRLGGFGSFELNGIEPPGKSADRTEKIKEIKLIRSNFKDGLYTENYFDAIRLMHVFEHIANPKECLGIISNYLKEDGLLCIEIPNVSSWQAQVSKANWFHLDPPRHLHLIPPKALIQFVEGRGFKLSNFSSFSMQFGPFGFQQSLLNALYKKRDVLYELLKGNKSYVKPYSILNLSLQLIFFVGSFPLFLVIESLASFFNAGSVIRLEFKKEFY